MASAKIYCPDIECDSCVRLISKKLKHIEGVERFDVNKDHVDVVYNDKVKLSNIIGMIRDLGFRADTQPFIGKAIKEHWRDFISNRKKYALEYKMLNNSWISLLLLLVMNVVLIFILNQPIAKYGWWLFYINVSIVSLGAALWQLESYKIRLTPMLGMMIGMAFGMQSGMMIGTILGATNGMVVASMITLVLASALGWWSTRNGSVMGLLQGIMSAIMGAVMGAMTGVMLFVDRILVFMPLFMILNVIVMWLVSLMVFEEFAEDNKDIEVNEIGFWQFFGYLALFSLLAFIIMVYGPKTGFASL
jgi:copper chaperone CopZ